MSICQPVGVHFFTVYTTWRHSYYYTPDGLVAERAAADVFNATVKNHYGSMISSLSKGDIFPSLTG